MPPAPSRRSTRYRPASSSPTRSPAKLGRTSSTAPSRFKNHDPSGHGRPVDHTLVWVRSRIAERHRIGLVRPDQDHAVPEDLRGQAGRLDAVRPGGIPGPRDAAARRYRVHGGVLAAVAGTAEEVISHRDLADRAAAPAAPAAPPAPVRRGPPAARRQRKEDTCPGPWGV